MTLRATIWHYPRCSKSRKTLAILRNEGVDVDVRHYRDDPPDRATLVDVIDRLAIAPAELVRTGDDRFAQLDVDPSSFDDDDWIDLMCDHPELIERPVVLTDSGAAIGRPPESVLQILTADAD